MTERGAYEKVIIPHQELPVVVLQNKKETSNPRFQLCSLHWHEQLELHYIKEGTLEIWINENQYKATAGDLLVVNSNDTHISYCCENITEQILLFHLEDLSNSLSEATPIFQHLISADPKVQDLMRDFNREYSGQELGYEAACKGLLLQLLVYLSRNYPQIQAKDTNYQKHTQQITRLLPALEYIQLHFSEDIDSSTLAAMVYLSPGRFHHLFKSCIGIPPGKFINNIRLHTAYGWLEAGQYSPYEAASQAGFTDYNHFGRLFRNTFGCTPSSLCSKK